mmetsp:Transcript_8706/g.32122  ORF Transcript_8706/g.32122 Transcript_8706/m.32122 type:complete len:99 (-) Transcript_8706:549-845(-)
MIFFAIVDGDHSYLYILTVFAASNNKHTSIRCHNLRRLLLLAIAALKACYTMDRASDSSSQLQVLRHDSDTLRVYSTEIAVFEEMHYEVLGGLLQRHE